MSPCICIVFQLLRAFLDVTENRENRNWNSYFALIFGKASEICQFRISNFSVFGETSESPNYDSYSRLIFGRIDENRKSEIGPNRWAGAKNRHARHLKSQLSFQKKFLISRGRFLMF